VTLIVPLLALNQVDAARCDWLVPGLAREKITRLAKSLPQKLRHQFGALPDFIDAFLAVNETQNAPLSQAMARYARRELNLTIPLDAFRQEMLPAHLSMNFRVVDEHGRQLGRGATLRSCAPGWSQRRAKDELAKADAPAARFTAWDFGDLEEVMEIRRGSQTLIGYPGLVDHGDSISLDVFDSAEGRARTPCGLRRLFMLQLKEQARHIREERRLAGDGHAVLGFRRRGGAEGTAARGRVRSRLHAGTLAEDRANSTGAAMRRAHGDAPGQEIARLAGRSSPSTRRCRKTSTNVKAFPEPCCDIQEARPVDAGTFMEDAVRAPAALSRY
jgi:ATP-dependent helicase HrpA